LSFPFGLPVSTFWFSNGIFVSFSQFWYTQREDLINTFFQLRFYVDVLYVCVFLLLTFCLSVIRSYTCTARRLVFFFLLYIFSFYIMASIKTHFMQIFHPIRLEKFEQNVFFLSCLLNTSSIHQAFKISLTIIPIWMRPLCAFSLLRDESY
jgi:hypothetical protein